MNLGPQKLLHSLTYSALTVFLLLYSRPLYAQMLTSYRGELELPAPLYTGDGIRLDEGKFQVEVRSEKASHFLVFLRNGEAVAVVNGQSTATVDKVGKDPEMPFIGTVYLYPAKTPARESQNVKKRDPGKAEKQNFQFTEHLRSRPWKAALRAYGHSEPKSNEIHFVFQKETQPGEWSRTDFKLFLRKPA